MDNQNFPECRFVYIKPCLILLVSAILILKKVNINSDLRVTLEDHAYGFISYSQCWFEVLSVFRQFTELCIYKTFFFFLSIRLCLCLHLNVCGASLPVRGRLPQCTKCVHCFLKETSLWKWNVVTDSLRCSEVIIWTWSNL